jgi:hypothetical protein
MEEFIMKSQDGVPSMNVPSLNPLRIPYVQLDPGAESSVAIKLQFRDVEIYGIKDPEVTKTAGFDQNPSKSKFEVHLKLKRIEMLSNYNISGRVLILPIVGTGRSNLTFGEYFQEYFLMFD